MTTNNTTTIAPTSLDALIEAAQQAQLDWGMCMATMTAESPRDELDARYLEFVQRWREAAKAVYAWVRTLTNDDSAARISCRNIINMCDLPIIVDDVAAWEL